jgi:thiol-disulfide isomerase/thioredoxin
MHFLKFLLPIAALSAISSAAFGQAVNSTHSKASLSAKVMVDQKAFALLDQVEAKLQSIHSLSVTQVSINGYPPDWIKNKTRQFGTRTSIRLLRPNFARQDVSDLTLDHKKGAWKAESTPIMSFASNGTTTWRLFGSQYDKSVDDKRGKGIGVEGLALGGFFDPGQSWSHQVRDMLKHNKLIALKLGGYREWNGTQYQTVMLRDYVDYPFGKEVINHTPGGRMQETYTLFIGSDMLIHRIESVYSVGWSNVEYIENIKTNEPETQISFAFKLPKDATPETNVEPPVLANGSVAPDFTVYDPTGKSVHLSDYKGKVVVLDFWATWCGPCQQSLPATNKVAEQFLNKNVVFLAVNTSDTKDAFNSWLPEHKQYDALQFAIDPADPQKNIATTLYKVSGIPTQFVIDTQGKVTWSLVGYDDSTANLIKAVTAAGATQ